MDFIHINEKFHFQRKVKKKINATFLVLQKKCIFEKCYLRKVRLVAMKHSDEYSRLETGRVNVTFDDKAIAQYVYDTERR